MGFALENVVPWGRSFDEYRRMFDLSSEDLRRSILCCADGPAGFNAEAKRRGHSVVSCDPIYRFAAEAIRQRIEETYPLVIENTRKNRDAYLWNVIQSPDELGEVRMAAMHLFLNDYPLGVNEGRYLEMSLPELALPDDRFDLALCSHFLFTYSEHFSQSFHLASVLEMARVAREVRIFPIINLDGQPSPRLIPVMEKLKEKGLTAELLPVPYEFQRGGNQMLMVTR